MTVSSSSLSREEMEEVVDRVRTLSAAALSTFQTMIEAFAPVAAQFKEQIEELENTHPWLFQLPPKVDLDQIEDEFEREDDGFPDPHPYTHGWDSQGDAMQGKCNVCGCAENHELHQGLVDEVEESERPQPGDFCDDCQERVSSDGECECNQDYLEKETPALEERVVDPKLDGLPCVDCGCPQEQHPNPMCDAFSCEVSPHGVAHEHYWSKQTFFDEKVGRVYRKCTRMSCAPDPARKYADFGEFR